MLLKPKKFKNFKIKKGNMKSLNFKSKNLIKGNFGLKALEYTRLTSKQIETLYKIVKKKLQKKSKIYINIFPDIFVTKKKKNFRMGKGKGDLKSWICKIKPGKILFEINDNNINSNKKFILKALKIGSSKLSIKTKIIYLKKLK